MKKAISILFLGLALFMSQSCSTKNSHEFTGMFMDEYGDEFSLNEDMTATILFKGAKEEIKTIWYDKQTHATIEYNGDPQYYFLKDGNLYRHKNDMEEEQCAIKITYKGTEEE